MSEPEASESVGSPPGGRRPTQGASMRAWWLLSLLSMACACAARTDTPRIAEHERAPSEWCFHSAQGIDVYAPQLSDCPRPVSFSSDADHVLRRAGLDQDGFIGIHVIYVRGAIECNGIQTLGCTDVNRRISLVSLDCPWPRRLTQHELGHQALRTRGLPERRQDHGDPWWRSTSVTVRRN